MAAVAELIVRRRQSIAMSSGTPTEHQTTEGREDRLVQQRDSMRRAWLVLVLVAAVAVVLVISWRFMLPDGPRLAPGNLTERDKREISYLCRRHSIRYCIDNLRSGEFGAFSLGIRNLFKQKIDRLIDDRDGTYRAYVVVYDKQAPDGFNPWSRHQLTKTNAHWTILRSY